MAVRYQVANPLVTNLWLDTLTGEIFGESDTEAWRRFKKWVDDGGMPDPAPPMPTVKPEDTRPGKIAKLAAQAKQGLTDPSISTPGEKRMALIFGQALDALAALDPLPTDPVPITIPVAPKPPTPPAAPPIRTTGTQIRTQ